MVEYAPPPVIGSGTHRIAELLEEGSVHPKQSFVGGGDVDGIPAEIQKSSVVVI